MPLNHAKYHSKIYRDYRALGDGAFREVVHFYEKHEQGIQALDFREYFELTVGYVNALFETGAYHKHLLMVDLIIELTISENIRSYQREDLFHSMLFKKAASLYNLEKYTDSEYILQELVRMDPADAHAVQFLKKCSRRRYPWLVRQTRASSIFLFLLSALVISLEVLFVRPFYEMHAGLVESTRNSIFLMGLGILTGGDLLHRLLITYRVNRFVEAVKRSKSRA